MTKEETDLVRFVDIPLPPRRIDQYGRAIYGIVPGENRDNFRGDVRDNSKYQEIVRPDDDTRIGVKNDKWTRNERKCRDFKEIWSN